MKNKRLGIIPVVLVTVILLGMFRGLSKNSIEALEQVKTDINEKSTVVLNQDCDPVLLKEIIFDNGYCDTIEQEAAFIAQKLIERQKDTINEVFLRRLFGQKENNKSLYSLQKRDIGQVSAREADSLHVLNTILSVSREKIGVANDFIFDYDRSAYSGSDSIQVMVEKESKKTFKSLIRSEENNGCENVPVRLQLHYWDTIIEKKNTGNGTIYDTIFNPQVKTLGYLFTDSCGKVVFGGLDSSYSYSVLPIKEGYEYGRSQGVVGGEWVVEEGFVKRVAHRIKHWINGTHDNEFKFIEKEHRIPLFTNATLRQIKNERSIVVRTPDEFMNELMKSKWCLLLSWWALSLVIVFHPKRRFDFQAGLIVACCMFLTGLSVLMMFSMQDPVNDEIRGWDMTLGVMAGVALAIALQFVDVVKRYDREMIPFRNYAFLKKWHLRGLGWLVIALILTGLLFVPGLGRSVGGMRVNLALGPLVFQPSEIAKYLVVLFSAIFFAEYIKGIIWFGAAFVANLKKKLGIMGWMILGLVLLMFLYMALGDMGPALVLGITFVLLYSFSKSKLDLLGGTATRWKNFLRCDFMMLIYGVTSYALVLLLFHGYKHWYIWDSVVWLVVWVIIGLFSIRKPDRGIRIDYVKQVHETAIIMNLVIFIFILGSNAGKDSGVLKRLEDRTNMCTNTWGGMDKVFRDIKKGNLAMFRDDNDMERLRAIDSKGVVQDTIVPDVLCEPVSNTQVANSLWALASGGRYGQGWGHGKPSVVPAFHTDMILSSIGEQRGWWGLLFVIIAYGVLLFFVSFKGIKVGEELVIFICMGIATVTAVQLFVIALGSAGVIPLTGVTVPLLSYGKVSMILNIAAFGLALSLVTRLYNTQNAAVIQHRNGNINAFKGPFSIVGICFVVGCLFTLTVWAKYMVFQRNKTLVQPAFVINTQGAPVLEYNPRIGIITKEMYAGRIFDRNGLLLATSDKDDISGAIKDSLEKHKVKDLDKLKRRHLKRYYPFGEHLFFMVGDINSGLFFSYDENHPVGYMAEAQHLSYLRNFDNVLYDKEDHPAKVHLVTDKKQGDRFLKPKNDTTDLVVLRNYWKLLPYLKDGSGRKLRKHNESVEKGKFDLHLTVDAALQTDLQKSIKNYVASDYNYNNNIYLRISTVVLDAQNGDLLASANYPLPDNKRLRDEEEEALHTKRGFAVYSDNMKDKEWKAYTDRDLGTTYQTPPGSTAKVMSAMGGFRKLGVDAGNQRYYLTDANRIEKGIEPLGWVTMEMAIEKSSNCYFVNLVNEQDLYENLKGVYTTIGICIGGIIPYIYTAKSDTLWRSQYNSKIDRNRPNALNKYKLFKRGRLVKNKNGKYLTKGETNMNIGEWRWAWGQGYSDIVTKESFDFLASPLNMARVASTVVNNGAMPVTQYVLANNKYESRLRHEDNIRLIKPDEAVLLKGYMLKEAKKHRDNGHKIPSFVGSKTGTPERTIYYSSPKRYDRKLKKYVNYEEAKRNDGWYMFFVEGDDTHHPIAVAVRMERLPLGSISSHAVKLSENVVLNCLYRHGYLKKPQKEN